MDEKLNRMKTLTRQLQEASRAYYQEDREIISNFEYDRLYEELEALELATGIQLTGSPTSQVGYEAVEGLTKVTHEVPLLSLDKTKNVEELAAFLGDRTGLLSWKLDGLTVVLSYENGALDSAVTRGNGTIGEDVTHNARTFVNIPLRIPYPGRLLVRGEAVITYEDFENVNENISADEKYKNPRNLCSGTVRQLDANTVADRRVRYYAFAILSPLTESTTSAGSPVHNWKSKSDQLSALSDMGFDVVEYQPVSASSLADGVAAFRDKLPTFGIPSDGLVLTYDDIEYSLSLGATSKFPKDSLAFKWQDELAETTLRRIEWNTSRTGLINPVAIFDPVEIEGTTVSKAGLHNVSIIRQLELGIGDRLTVYKANMIIPQVAENLTRSNTAALPDVCPVCKSVAEVYTNREAEALYCLNPHCRAQLLGSLVHFCSRDAMNIEGLSEQTLEKWIERGFVADYTDIFALKRYEDEITQMEGFGQKSFSKLLAAIERATNVKLANFIYALGIKHVGLSNAKLLCRHFGDIEMIIEKIRSEGGGDELIAVKGFGEIIAHSLRVYFADENNLRRIRKVMGFLRIKDKRTAGRGLGGGSVGGAAGDSGRALSGDSGRGLRGDSSRNPIENSDGASGVASSKTSDGASGVASSKTSDGTSGVASSKASDGTSGEASDRDFGEDLLGYTFVITGSLSHFSNRRELQDHIEERGGKCTSAVSAATSYLINNDVASTSAKNKKAQELGIPILTEEAFLDLRHPQT